MVISGFRAWYSRQKRVVVYLFTEMVFCVNW